MFANFCPYRNESYDFSKKNVTSHQENKSSASGLDLSGLSF